MNPRLDLQLLVRRYGWPAVGLLLLPFVVALVLLGLWQAERNASPGLVLPTDGVRQLETHRRAFRAVIIPRGELESRQRAVLDAAARHGLTPGRVDYAYANSPAGDFGLATLRLPLTGSYADLRAFLAAALAAEPGLAVRDLSIQRRPAEPGVEAQVGLVFHTERLAEDAS